MEVKAYPDEAKCLSLYLTGRECTAKDAEDFYKAIQVHQVSLTERQEQLYLRMLGSRLFMKSVDGALALTNPHSLLRKRIYIMFCILETSKDFTDYFLPVKKNIFYLFVIGVKSAIAVALSLIGLVVLKISGVEQH